MAIGIVTKEKKNDNIDLGQDSLAFYQKKIILPTIPQINCSKHHVRCRWGIQWPSKWLTKAQIPKPTNQWAQSTLELKTFLEASELLTWRQDSLVL